MRRPSVWAEDSLVKDGGLPGHPDQYSWLLGADVSGGRNGKGLCPRGLFFFFNACASLCMSNDIFYLHVALDSVASVQTDKAHRQML